MSDSETHTWLLHHVVRGRKSGSSEKRTDVRDTGKWLDPVGGEKHERKLRSLRFWAGITGRVVMPLKEIKNSRGDTSRDRCLGLLWTCQVGGTRGQMDGATLWAVGYKTEPQDRAAVRKQICSYQDDDLKTWVWMRKSYPTAGYECRWSRHDLWVGLSMYRSYGVSWKQVCLTTSSYQQCSHDFPHLQKWGV